MSATSLSGLLKRSRASPRVNSCHLDLVILAPGPVGFCTQARRQMALPPCYAHQLPLPPSVSRSWVELCTRHQKRYHFLYPFFFFFLSQISVKTKSVDSCVKIVYLTKVMTTTLVAEVSYFLDREVCFLLPSN